MVLNLKGHQNRTISRPGPSQGLLYKHCGHSFAQWPFSSPRLYGAATPKRLEIALPGITRQCYTCFGKGKLLFSWVELVKQLNLKCGHWLHYWSKMHHVWLKMGFDGLFWSVCARFSKKYMQVLFHCIGPLGQFSLLVAITVCVCVCLCVCASFFFLFTLAFPQGKTKVLILPRWFSDSFIHL